MGYVWARSYSTLDKKLKEFRPTSSIKQWTPLDTGWVKLNFDGTVPIDGNFAAIGGVLRDFNARWIYGYNMFMGTDSIFKIEVRTMLEGLLLTWEKGYKQVQVESDNALLVNLLLAVEKAVVNWLRFICCNKLFRGVGRSD